MFLFSNETAAPTWLKNVLLKQKDIVCRLVPNKCPHSILLQLWWFSVCWVTAWKTLSTASFFSWFSFPPFSPNNCLIFLARHSLVFKFFKIKLPTLFNLQSSWKAHTNQLVSPTMRLTSKKYFLHLQHVFFTYKILLWRLKHGFQALKPT